MRTFKLPMEDVFVGAVTVKAINDANKQKIGERTLIDLLYIGGYVRVDVDKGFADTLKEGTAGKALISMEPAISAESRKNKDGSTFAFLDTGFENFKLIGFEPVDKTKFTAGK